MLEENRNSIRILVLGHRAVEKVFSDGETLGAFVHRISRPPSARYYVEEELQLSRTNRPYYIARREGGESSTDEDCILQPGDTLYSCGYAGYSVGVFHDVDSKYYITCQEEDIASCRTCNQRKAEVYGEQ